MIVQSDNIWIFMFCYDFFVGFMFFWGIVFFVTTTLVMIMKHEADDPDADSEQGILDTYKQLVKVIRLKPIISYAIILLTVKVRYQLCYILCNKYSFLLILHALQVKIKIDSNDNLTTCVFWFMYYCVHWKTTHFVLPLCCTNCKDWV